jgi:hypothetical protein
MADFQLLTLDLRSPLDYGGIENPPFSGVPEQAFIPGATQAAPAALAEGEEEVFLFDPEALVAFDPDDGPLLERPLPPPSYYGRRGASGSQPAGDGAYRVPAGSYAFLQWRPRDAEGLMEGLEWFAREAWWERVEATGPYILRRVREDGAVATQALRRLSRG